MKTLREKIAWAQSQSWCKAMSECVQNPVFHREGDVWQHTLMCCEALESLSEYRDLNDSDKQIVEWSVILHDVGKPSATTIRDNVIVTNNHAGRSESEARQILIGIDIPFKIRESICNIVRWHMFPAKIGSANDAPQHVVFTSWLCRNDLLYIIGKADSKGRISENRDSDTYIELWKEYCDKFACFHKPYDFYNSKARYEFYQSGKFQPYYKPYVGDMFEVIMLSGLPGVGKTYYAQNVFPDRPLVELDGAREELDVDPGEDESKVRSLTKEKCLELLRAKKPFLFGAVNHLKMTRSRWIRLFSAYHAEVSILYIERPMDVILHQNKMRKKVVPESVIMNMMSRLEVPNWNECHKLILREE